MNENMNLIKDFIESKLGIVIDLEEELQNLDGFNSMLVVEIILFLEEGYSIEIPDEYYDINHYKTINSIYAFVEKLIEKGR